MSKSVRRAAAAAMALSFSFAVSPFVLAQDIDEVEPTTDVVSAPSSAPAPPTTPAVIVDDIVGTIPSLVDATVTRTLRDAEGNVLTNGSTYQAGTRMSQSIHFNLNEIPEDGDFMTFQLTGFKISRDVGFDINDEHGDLMAVGSISTTGEGIIIFTGHLTEENRRAHINLELGYVPAGMADKPSSVELGIDHELINLNVAYAQMPWYVRTVGQEMTVVINPPERDLTNVIIRAAGTDGASIHSTGAALPEGVTLVEENGELYYNIARVPAGTSVEIPGIGVEGVENSKVRFEITSDQTRSYGTNVPAPVRVVEPTPEPTPEPEPEPTEEPTPDPEPTPEPTAEPTAEPTPEAPAFPYEVLVPLIGAALAPNFLGQPVPGPGPGPGPGAQQNGQAVETRPDGETTDFNESELPSEIQSLITAAPALAFLPGLFGQSIEQSGEVVGTVEVRDENAPVPSPTDAQSSNGVAAAPLETHEIQVAQPSRELGLPTVLLNIVAASVLMVGLVVFIRLI